MPALSLLYAEYIGVLAAFVDMVLTSIEKGTQEHGIISGKAGTLRSQICTRSINA